MTASIGLGLSKPNHTTGLAAAGYDSGVSIGAARPLCRVIIGIAAIKAAYSPHAGLSRTGRQDFRNDGCSGGWFDSVVAQW